MHEKNENIFYYITTMNENYTHPEMPKDKNFFIVTIIFSIIIYWRYIRIKIIINTF